MNDRAKIAVLAIHGMGTQQPLTGIQAAVETLMHLPGARVLGARSESHGDGEQARVVSQATVGFDASDLPPEVDVFEAHYAAIPKGKSGVLEILQFLLLAGWNGLGAEQWRRWLFGKIRDCSPKPLTHARLVLALAALLATIALNVTFFIELVAMGIRGSVVLTNPALELQRTLSVAFIAIFATGALFGISLWLCLRLESSSYEPSTAYRIVAFAVFVLATALPFVIIFATLYVVTVQVDIVHAPRVELNANLPWFLLVRAAGAVAATALIVQVLANHARWRIGGVLIFCVALVAYLLATYNQDPVILAERIMALDFVLLGIAFVFASLIARMFLIDYVGDVAAYIGGSRASKFAETREAIQNRVFQMLDRLLRDGYTVVVFAHSLGSVVGYDVVNRALLDQRRYRGRIGGMVTYGSPLDKIAYLFQLEDRFGDRIRNTLVASRQPLVWEDTRRDIVWWNVQARYDIVGSRLIYYNVEPNARWNHRLYDVRNYDDLTNLVPILSHTRYHGHPTLSRVVHKALAHAHCHEPQPPETLPTLEVR
jgi:hypothetical protein